MTLPQSMWFWIGTVIVAVAVEVLECTVFEAVLVGGTWGLSCSVIDAFSEATP